MKHEAYFSTKCSLFRSTWSQHFIGNICSSSSCFLFWPVLFCSNKSLLMTMVWCPVRDNRNIALSSSNNLLIPQVATYTRWKHDGAMSYVAIDPYRALYNGLLLFFLQKTEYNVHSYGNLPRMIFDIWSRNVCFVTFALLTLLTAHYCLVSVNSTFDEICYVESTEYG